ncbi:MAG: TetR/AcrR family transcriptional regulator, partial [Proteobacteria bacterium]|nr:TetR/AcrR family transcriptional regulator [Pseudomonadota bacterium]
MVITGRSKSKKRREDRRKTILVAAMGLFTHFGYEKTTMQQVVEAAGTSIGNCYFYFPNKEALLHALVEELIQNVWVEVEDLIDEGATNVMELAIATNTLLRKLLDTKMYLLFFKGSTKARLA